MTIYFVEMVNEPCVKIGYTAGTAEKRMAQLQTGQPQKLRLLGTIPGDKHGESGLHKHFADLRLNGEWFEKTERLLAIIRDLVANQRAWYFCRLFDVAIKKMEHAWVAAFEFQPNTDLSAYEDHIFSYKRMDTEAQLAKANQRIEAYEKRHGEPPPWAKIIRGRCFQYKNSYDPKSYRYLQAWQGKDVLANAALGA